jgi:MYXO-CTERM domain-containing protein
VGAADYETGVFGDEEDLPAEAAMEMSYVMFDTSALSGAVSRATLTLHVRPDGSSGGSGASVWSVGDTSWREDTLTWATRPSPTGRVASFAALTPGETVDVDVTSAVTTGGRVAFAIVSDGTDGLHLASKEYGDGSLAAELTVVTREESDADADTDADTDAGATDTGWYDDWKPREPRETKEESEADGCGCASGSPAGWLAVLLAAAMRRRS